MIKSSIRKYVEEQLRNQVDPKYIRYNLLQAGWPQKEVDETLAKVLTWPDASKKSGNKHLLAYLIIVVAILVGVTIFIYTYYQDSLFSPVEIPPDQPTYFSSTPESPQITGCADINESIKKDECYKNLIKNNHFDCDKLTDRIERNFCFRAWDFSVVETDRMK